MHSFDPIRQNSPASDCGRFDLPAIDLPETGGGMVTPTSPQGRRDEGPTQAHGVGSTQAHKGPMGAQQLPSATPQSRPCCRGGRWASAPSSLFWTESINRCAGEGGLMSGWGE